MMRLMGSGRKKIGCGRDFIWGEERNSDAAIIEIKVR